VVNHLLCQDDTLSLRSHCSSFKKNEATTSEATFILYPGVPQTISKGRCNWRAGGVGIESGRLLGILQD